MGTIKAELWPDKAPVSVGNFLTYVHDKFYDGLVFHRVIKGFMIQGGGFDANMSRKKTKPPIKNEAKADVSNARGTLAMARTSIPDSATSQFYINHGNNQALDKGKCRDGVGYCVFGKVTDGMDVVDKIASAPTGIKNGMRDVPVTTIEIKSIRIQQTTPKK